MAAVLHRLKDTGYMFWCPGCKEPHAVWVDARNDITGARWQFNGSMEQPTFSPSILLRSGHHADGNKQECWCTYNAQHPAQPAPYECVCCHSFVRNGSIEFLQDCTHELAGKTVALEPF